MLMKMKYKFNLRYLRKTLKYRPDILKLILKLRDCNKKKSLLIQKLQNQLELLLKNYKQGEQNNGFDNTEPVSRKEVYIQCEILSMDFLKDVPPEESSGQQCKTSTKDSLTLTQHDENQSIGKVTTKDDNQIINTENSKKSNDDKKDAGWNPNETMGKSIAEQVTEAAQNVLQQSGMVYVESAGMYYDYKTGYYYHSELGLYYHTDTGCYYYYNNDKQEFVFHSYPDTSKIPRNASLEEHERRKARKQKRVQQREDIENITKNIAKDKEDEDAPKRKKKKISTEKTKKLKRNRKTRKGNSENANSKKETALKSTSDQAELDSESKETKIEKDDETDRSNVVNKVECSESLEDGECSNTESEVSETLEDGECSDTGSEVEDDEVASNASTATDNSDDSVAKHQPPCIRVIVRETTLPNLKVGTLFLVTKDGGTVGREGDHHTILLRDKNVSRNHLNIKYDPGRRMYVATDLGSKNGTLLNGIQMSESQIVSKEMEIVHGSTIQLGESKLLCHIHPGNDTCGHCEPGLIMQSLEKGKAAYTRTCSVKKQHELELARLKNKYAKERPAIEDGSYKDRAKERRDTVGSSHYAEKTQSADVDTFIAPDNKGFKMLEKMGWSKGEGLGKDSQGEAEPVPLVSNEGKAGMGAGGVGTPGSTAPAPKRVTAPRITLFAAKSKLLQPPAKAFNHDSDQDSE